MTISRPRSHPQMSTGYFVSAVPSIASVHVAAVEHLSVRVNSSVEALTDLSDASTTMTSEQHANADCVAVIPGLKKGAAVGGASYGRGFTSIGFDLDGMTLEPDQSTTKSAGSGSPQ
ncbi:MAG: hypothetical protein JO217_01885 [Acidobacteriaceae bacterium]|nr:hypothetical protein [Acidobacteriaceae bacterium]MBV9441422.1 hypothetical protein [Acidobacteriaceae bacterium]